MMTFLRTWLLGLAAAAVLTSLAQSLMPQGPVKKAGGLVCALVLLWAMLFPLTQGASLEPAQLAQDYLDQVEQQAKALQAQVQAQRKAVIEAELEAYILDKAAQQGISPCQARVECRENREGVFVPETAWVSAPEQAWPALRRLLEEDLGIPAEGQTYEKEAAA